MNRKLVIRLAEAPDDDARSESLNISFLEADVAVSSVSSPPDRTEKTNMADTMLRGFEEIGSGFGEK